MLKELIGYFNSIKKDMKSIKKEPVRSEGYINEIKNNLQGNNSRVDEAEN